MAHRLPILAERAIADLRCAQAHLADSFVSVVRNTLDRQDLNTISCKAGCDNCCYHPLYLDFLEAILLYRHLVSHGEWTPDLRKRLEAHGALTMGLSPGIWLGSLIACPLLEGHRCLAYGSRPLSCRISISYNHPSGCHPHNLTPESMLPKREILGNLHERAQEALRPLGVAVFSLPMGYALLLAEKLCTGQIEMETRAIAATILRFPGVDL